MSREALVRLQTYLEDQLPVADESARVRLGRELAECRQALEWDEIRQRGRHHFVWQGGTIIPVFLVCAGLQLGWILVQGPRPSTALGLASVIALPAVFGGCIAVLYKGWNAAERRYARQLEQAQRLLNEARS